MFATRRAAVRAFLRTVGVGALTGTAAVCLAMLSDLGRLIGDIHSAGQRSYDPSVFTRFRLIPYRTDELADAMRLWRDIAPSSGFEIRDLLALLRGVDTGVRPGVLRASCCCCSCGALGTRDMPGTSPGRCG